VLVDDRGPYVGDLRALRQPIDDELVQGIGIGNRHMDAQTIVATLLFACLVAVVQLPYV